MNNVFNYLAPKNGEKEKFDDIIKKYSLDSDCDILWYHSAGSDFRSLYFGGDRFNPDLKSTGKPGLFIYTDMSYFEIETIRNGDIFRNEKENGLKINSFAEVEFEDNIKNYLCSTIREKDKEYILNKNAIFLIDVELGDKNGNVPLLYFIWENTAFLKAFILKRGLKIKYMQKPMEYGFGGGWTPSQVYMLYYIGLMETEYLYLEECHLYHQYEEEVEKIINGDKDLIEGFLSENNYIPDVERIGHTLGRMSPNNERWEHYSILKLSRNKDEKRKMTYDEKRNEILRKLEIKY